MAFLTFLVRRKPIATYQLNGVVTMGRSLDCDIYVPDVFVSRRHCRFENHNGNWHILEWESRNGIWTSGARHKDYLLKPGDIIEVGTVAFSFNEGTPDGASNPAPYGMGPGVTELMDTVFAHELRPSTYTKTQAARKAEFRDRVKNRKVQTQPEEDDDEVAQAAAWSSGEEWAELDIEMRFVGAQYDLGDWKTPIFKPIRPGAAGGAAEEPTALYELSGVVALSESEAKSMASRGVQVRPMQKPAAKAGESLLSAAAATMPFGLGRKQPAAGKSKKEADKDAYSWRDRLADAMDIVREKCAGLMVFAKLNPAVAAAVVLGVALVLVAAARYSPLGADRGTHVYIPPRSEQKTSKAQAPAPAP
jgi:hypothetical protein